MIVVYYQGVEIHLDEGKDEACLEIVERHFPADPEKRRKAAQRHEAWKRENEHV